MVDITTKAKTFRLAEASAKVLLGVDAYSRLKSASLQKGDALLTAKIAGISAAKRTSELIPLCHSIHLQYVDIDFFLDDQEASVRIHSSVKCNEATGVEMEALTASSVAALTLYDMCKSFDKGIRIKDVHLVKKKGGKSGDYEYMAFDKDAKE